MQKVLQAGAQPGTRNEVLLGTSCTTLAIYHQHANGIYAHLDCVRLAQPALCSAVAAAGVQQPLHSASDGRRSAGRAGLLHPAVQRGRRDNHAVVLEPVQRHVGGLQVAGRERRATRHGLYRVAQVQELAGELHRFTTVTLVQAPQHGCADRTGSDYETS